MSNAAIGWSDWGDVATLETIGNEPGSGPVAANLLTMQPQDVWQSSNLSSLHFELDRGSAATWNCVALLFTNATGDATWRIRAADDQASLTDDTEDYDSGTISMRAAGADDTYSRAHAVLFVPAGVTRRWLRIDITDGANPDTVFRAGRLVVGNLWQPSRNVQHPMPFGHRDDTTQTRTDGGALIPADVGEPYQVADLRFDFLSETDALDQLYEFRRKRGRRRDLLVLLKPNDATHMQQRTLYGLISRDEPIIHRGFNRFQHRIELEELL